MKFPLNKNHSQATTLLYLVGAMAVLTLLTTSVLLTATRTFVQSARMKETLQVLHLAQAGLALGTYRLQENSDYTGEGPIALAKGEFDVRIERTGGRLRIVATGYFPNARKPRQIRRLSLNLER